MGGTASTSEFADAVIEALQGEAWREQAARETNPV
jgi:xanthine dehydrogenase iron-sulfur cluster and FAD-binding subunit A